MSARSDGGRRRLCEAGLHLHPRWWHAGKGCPACNQAAALEEAVGALRAAEPGLSLEWARAAVERAAPTTRVRQALAQELRAGPDRLRSGTPAPPVVARLIAELRALGVDGLEPPRCLDCGEPRKLECVVEGGRVCRRCHRRRRTPEPCARCGHSTRADLRDADGGRICQTCRRQEPSRQQRCGRCGALGEAVAREDGLVVGRCCYVPPRLRCTVCGVRAGQAVGWRTRRRVCEECRRLESSPCARCGLDALPDPTADDTLCAHCAGERSQPCLVCGALTVARDREGRPRCGGCYERPRGRCGRCGNVRVIVRRARGGEPDLCGVCWQGPTVRCEGCGRLAPCRGERRGRMLCRSCAPATTRICARCGQPGRAQAHWPEGPVCANCYQRALGAKARCPACGETRRLLTYPGFPEPVCSNCAGAPRTHVCGDCGAEDDLYERGRCARCSLERRLTDLLGDEHTRARTGLEPVFAALLGAPKPRAVLRWLQSESPAIDALGRIAAGELPLAHESLDRLPPSRALNFLEHLLVASGALPARDPALARLERWIDHRLATIINPDQRQLVRTFVRWAVLRRYRSKSRRSHLSDALVSRAKAELNAAAALLAWLAQRGTELGGCRQADIDAWLAEGPASRRVARPFVRWAISQGLVRQLDFPAGDRELVGTPVDHTERAEVARRLLHDPGIHPTDRIAGTLVVLFAQPLSRIARLTIDDVAIDARRVTLRLGDTPLELPEPLAGHLRELIGMRRSLAAAALPAHERWLFAGASPGRPIGELALGRRLRRLGVACGPHRSAALLELCGQVPAPVMADLLGLHINTATRWGELAGRHRASYLSLREGG